MLQADSYGSQEDADQSCTLFHNKYYELLVLIKAYGNLILVLFYRLKKLEWSTRYRTFLLKKHPLTLKSLQDDTVELNKSQFRPPILLR